LAIARIGGMIEAARRSVLHTDCARRCAKSGKVGFSTRDPPESACVCCFVGST